MSGNSDSTEAREPKRSGRDRSLTYGAIVLLSIVAIVLYGPFLANERVFDDLAFYLGNSLSDLATVPISLRPRQFPYFTIAAVDVLTDHSDTANRLFSVMVHVGCAVAMFEFLRRLLATAGDRFSSMARPSVPANHVALAFAAALVFLVHPVSVYGAGYLVQRTILFACFFSILSALQLLNALETGKRASIWWAAAAYTAAVLSKEHAITAAPAIAIGLLLWRRALAQDFRRVATYLVLCTPAALVVLFPQADGIGRVYEFDAAEAIAEIDIPAMHSSLGRWFVSMVVQAGLFADYWFSWLAPSVDRMSADLRIDFEDRWSAPRGLFGVVGYGVALVGGIVALKSANTGFRVSGLGIIIAGLTYLPEFARPRFQEPFVLYRSYLWAPWFLLIAISPFLRVRARAVAVTAVLVSAYLASLSIDRLKSFSTPMSLWTDAAAKLTSPGLPGSARIFFNRGTYEMASGQLDSAHEIFDALVRDAPNNYRGYLGRGQTHARLGRLELARADLEEAVRLKPMVNQFQFELGLVLEFSGHIEDARKAYETASRLGHAVAGLRLRKLEGTASPPAR